MKIALFESQEYYNEHDYYSKSTLCRQITNWIEVSDREYKCIMAGIEVNRFNTNGMRVCVIRQIDLKDDGQDISVEKLIELGDFQVKRVEQHDAKLKKDAENREKNKEKKQKRIQENFL